MNHDEGIKQLEAMEQSLVEKSPLLLMVEVSDQEAASELLRWMYSKDKPMKAQLLELAWDREMVTKKQAEAIRMIREAE